MIASLRRLKTITERAERLSTAQKKEEIEKAPFCEVLINRLLGDGAAIIHYHPQGRQGPTEERQSTLVDALAWIDENHIPAHCNLYYCPLWTHVFYQQSELYTTEQKQRFRESDIEQYPEVAELYSSEDKDGIMDYVAGMPQFLNFGGRFESMIL